MTTHLKQFQEQVRLAEKQEAQKQLADECTKDFIVRLRPKLKELDMELVAHTANAWTSCGGVLHKGARTQFYSWREILEIGVELDVPWTPGV